MSGLQLKYFVLNPNKDDVYGEASRCAMQVYANTIIKENHELARDLQEWLDALAEKGLDP